MRNLFLWTVALIASLHVQAQWDRPMTLNTCSIDIKADQFTATTFIEMEFCNSQNREMEGLYRFQLKPGQVITAFQLQLDGKYREGSIEEKWKATNAYNRIVGKRIDPALLTMEYPDHYSLRIYPVPGQGCRKVTMTILQLLTPVNSDLIYTLPLSSPSPVDDFSLSITVSGKSSPRTTTGLISNQVFSLGETQHILQWNTRQLTMNQPLAFAIPISPGSSLCTKSLPGQTYFALRHRPSIQEYSIQPKTLDVYWDASASAAKRNINKEINFLRQFLSYHSITQLTIIPFNHKQLDTAIFHFQNGADNRWQQYLQALNYDGATQLGVITAGSSKADMILLFTDGNNTFGRSRPVTGETLVSCVNSSPVADVTTLREIAGSSGGKVIDLAKLSMSAAIHVASRGENWLMNITSASGRIITEQSLPQKFEEHSFINGSLAEDTDTLYLHYGNNARIHHIEKLVVGTGAECTGSAVDRLSMLQTFDRICRSSAWSAILDFGLKEKIVTPNTAYIVLERIEDYIKYNIAPPKELEPACEKMNYVKKDTRAERQKIIKLSEFDIVYNVVHAYNDRIRNWDPVENRAYLLRLPGAEASIVSAPLETKEQWPLQKDIAVMNSSGNSGEELSEVVVGYARRRESGAATTYLANDKVFAAAPTVVQALEGRVPGIQITRESVAPGSSYNIRIRGQHSAISNAPLYVIDGIPVSGELNDLLHPDDVESITILKDFQATAIYGSRAAAGAIIITTKKNRGRTNYYNDKPYRLKDMPDEDYLEELKAASRSEKLEVYGRLREEYGGYAGFYFDMAQHLYESGFGQEAVAVLMNAAEAANGHAQVELAIAYTLEAWKEYDKAIDIYQQLIEQSPARLRHYSNLAWLYYQAGRYQEAIDIFFHAIKMDTGAEESSNVSQKATMMTDMNTIISMHREQLNLGHIPASLIRPMPVDMRIVIDCNRGHLSSIRIKEPNGAICDDSYPLTSNGGRLYHQASPDYCHSIDYQLKKAVKGKYKIAVIFYDRSDYTGKVPTMIRLRKFKNFGNENQSLEVENVIIDNQMGEFEISELSWKQAE